MVLRKDKRGIYLPSSWKLVTITSSKSKLRQPDSYCEHGAFTHRGNCYKELKI